MRVLTLTYAVVYYAAALVFVAGVAYRMWVYSQTPAPLKVPTTPAPTTQAGAAFRVLREVVLFESLFKSNKWIWVFGYMFHAALALVILRHLRYLIDKSWFFVPDLAWEGITLVQPFGKYAGFAMLAGLLALWARRFVVPRVRYVSDFSDHLMLLLLIFIGISGLGMKYVNPTDIIAVKMFFIGLITFDIQPLPADRPLLVHLALVAALMIVFPFSKLLHAPGLFFSPSRHQADNTREKRYVPRLHTDATGEA
ncbi:MAG: respiratory nitrate reductase subunit gamma [Alphaproteobacteria bacterium]